MSTQTAADLRAAADLLERAGWTQKRYESPDGCKCVMGAVYTALGLPVNGGGEHDSERVTDARLAIADQVNPIAGAGVTFWNDTPGRTADEVIAALRAAADTAEAQP